VLELRNLKKDYDGRIVLDVERLTLEAGDVVALLGPNGSGKTTLLEIMAFLLEPSQGELLFEGRRVNHSRSDLQDLRRKVVLVEQQPILFSTTVLRNVEFPLRIRGVKAKDRLEIALEQLELVGMDGLKGAQAARLSGGETQRVAIARALACRPRVLLLDEPTSNVDMENRAVIERLIGQISRENNIPIVFSTHSMLQAARLAGRSLFLYEGRVSRSAHENIYSGRLERIGEGGSWCILPAGIRLKTDSPASGPARISIYPEGLELKPADTDNTQINMLKGKLYQLVDHAEHVRVRVDVGIPIGFLIPKEIFRLQRFNIGDEVRVIIPPENIQVV